MRIRPKLKRFSGLRQAYAAGLSARLNRSPQIPAPKPQTPSITTTKQTNEH